jgi:uncharacterized protein YqeY
MKAGKTADRDALRMLLADLLKEEKEKAGTELSDEAATTVVNRIVKRTRGSIEEFSKVGASDTVAKLEAELVVYQRYAPEQLGEDAVKALVAEAVAETGASGPADMGKVMKALMPKVTGKADGQLVSRLVKESLQK